jgi:hypothetical protein
MKNTMTKIRGIGYLFWHTRHMLYHLLLGTVWVWMVKDQLGIYGPNFLFISLLGSIFPDFEHLLFFFTYGQRDAYTKQIKGYISHGDWRVLIRFIEQGHKYNTKLRYHNIYAIFGLTGITTLLFATHAYSGFIFTGAMVIHYLFDILDDLASLGRLNKNWFRWGTGKLPNDASIWKYLDKTIPRR